ncbi:acyltransferase MBOAT family [Butyrivibrio proteoclasticus B316]|uniref:Acyltransferase MBOAT family n=1 Tax=Butyrivibrio proteoclasticus (strain ATCC 51982 / DSM 14932 / B316) TaxID=515622 RepID=E0RWX7_BUTPB|nr:MBOAT family O-acyltransferase [Butyrivibrio proteoclasticus]ADL34885.1 acyltransferase MBOAT family [Butyrivibrio proteoclasticus B316]
MINFSDLTFIFRFLPVFIVAFYLTPYEFRTLTLLLGSLVFYGVGDIKMFPVLLGAVIINYLFSRALKGGGSKVLLGFAIVLDALMLVEFKLLGQFVDSSFMPIGVSFFTFKMISFQIDNYRGKVDEKAGFLDIAAYFVMFPQIVSGPIMRFEDYVKNPFMKLWNRENVETDSESASETETDQEKEIEVLETVKNDSDSDSEIINLDTDEGMEKLEDTGKNESAAEGERPSKLAAIEDGIRFFVIGLAFKVLLADHLSMLWRDIGTIGYESISTALAWLGAYTYSMELYFDFWGYSLMAAGIGVMLGFPFIVNFDQPYGSKNVSEFYRRWHATLGSWFRDYIYFPMGGSRKGNLRTILNLLTVWLITGFWHGVTLNFILWGMIIFVIILCERFILSKLPKFLGDFIGRINVLVLIPLTWVVFALPDNGMLSTYFMRLFPFFGVGVSINQGDFIKNVGIYGIVLGTGLILMIPAVYGFFVKHRKNPVFTVGLLLLFWACVYSLSNAAGNPFMYFKF